MVVVFVVAGGGLETVVGVFVGDVLLRRSGVRLSLDIKLDGGGGSSLS